MTVNPAYTTTSDGSIKWGFFRLPHARLLGAGVVTSDSGNQSGSLLSPGKDRLLLPASGYRNYDDGNLAFVGQTGYFWTSTPAIDPADNGESYLMFIYDNGNVDSRLNDHRYGFAVRCIQNYNNR
jgi:hypothetical protein